VSNRSTLTADGLRSLFKEVMAEMGGQTIRIWCHPDYLDYYKVAIEHARNVDSSLARMKYILAPSEQVLGGRLAFYQRHLKQEDPVVLPG
jgi:hypothetical protein